MCKWSTVTHTRYNIEQKPLSLNLGPITTIFFKFYCTYVQYSSHTWSDYKITGHALKPVIQLITQWKCYLLQIGPFPSPLHRSMQILHC
jgi:hypothetical protein